MSDRAFADPVAMCQFLPGPACSQVGMAIGSGALVLGYGIRSRRLRAAQQDQVARLTRDQAVREADLRAQVERERFSGNCTTPSATRSR